LIMEEELKQDDKASMFALVNHWKTITICIIIFSCLRSSLFYSYFKIDIGPYIQWDEIFTLIINSLPHIITLVSIALLIGFLIAKETISKLKTEDEVEDFAAYAKKVRIILFSVISLSGAISVGISIIQKKDISTILFLGGIYCVGIMAIFAMTTLTFFLKYVRDKTSNENFGVVVALVATIFMAFLSSTIEYTNLKNNKPTGSYIEMGKVKVTSTSDCYIIGRTKAYVFFYNEKSNIAEVYPVSQITKSVIQF